MTENNGFTPQEIENLDSIVSGFIATVERLSTNLEALEDLRTEIESLQTKLYAEYDKRSEQIEEKIPLASYKQFMEDWSESLREILIANTEKAISESEEFNYPFFSNRLIKAASDPEVVEFVLRKQVQSNPLAPAEERWMALAENITTDFTPIDVFIHMDKVAGTISDYFAAVNSAREAMNLGAITRVNVSTGAKVFFEKYYGVDRENNRIIRYRRTNESGRPKRKFVLAEYGKVEYTDKDGNVKRRRRKKDRDQAALEKKETQGFSGEDITDKYRGKYNLTLETRAGFFTTGIAPFWRILEHGSVQYGGEVFAGSNFISQKATNFVETSKTKIKERANIEYSRIKREISREFRKELQALQDNIDDLTTLLADIEKYILQAQEETVRKVRDFREDPSDVNERITYARSVFAQRLRQAGMTNQDEIYQAIEEATNALLGYGGTIISRGRVAYHTARGEYKTLRTAQMLEEFRQIMGR